MEARPAEQRSHEQPTQYLTPGSSTAGRRRATYGRRSNRAVSIEVEVTRCPAQPESLKRTAENTLSGKLELDDSAFQADHGGMRSVVGPQFGQDVSDLALDGFFADRKLGSNLFVGIPFGNQAQDTDFRRGQRVICGMLGELHGGLSGKRPFPSVH